METETPTNTPPSSCWDRGYNFDTGIECDSSNCSGTHHIADSADGLIHDGNECECYGCGITGSICIFEDGEMAVIPNEKDASA